MRVGNKNSKSKTLKNTNANKNVFFRAFFVSLAIAAVVWIVLAAVFAFVLSKQADSNLAVKILSPILCAVSLVAGGFAAGKADKANAFLISLMLGCTVLAICYGISVTLDFSSDMGYLSKTGCVALMLLCPVAGAGIAGRKGHRKARHKRKM